MIHCVAYGSKIFLMILPSFDHFHVIVAILAKGGQQLNLIPQVIHMLRCIDEKYGYHENQVVVHIAFEAIGVVNLLDFHCGGCLEST
jgi:hypothetical protein